MKLGLLIYAKYRDGTCSIEVVKDLAGVNIPRLVEDTLAEQDGHAAAWLTCGMQFAICEEMIRFDGEIRRL